MDELDLLPVAPAAPASSSASLPATSNALGIPVLGDKLLSLQGPEVDPESCELLGPFALGVQTLMGAIVLASLLVKRQRERPRRKLRVWAADVSKQVIGQLFVHFLNLFISSHIASLPAGGNPCALYFINILVDTTIGVFFVYLSLRLVTHLLTITLGTPLRDLGLVSGHYPPPYLSSWLRQLGVYLSALGLMKLAVVAIFWVGGAQLVRFGDGIIEMITGDPNVQVLISVMIGPCILNVLQFLLIDSLIKMKGESVMSPELLETDEDEEARHSFLGRGRGFEDDDSDEGEVDKADSDVPKSRRSFHKPRPNNPPSKHALPNGGKANGAAQDDSPTTVAHSYPPTSAAPMSRSLSNPIYDGEKSGSKSDLAGEGEGWDEDEDNWAEWGMEDDDPLGKADAKVARSGPEEEESDDGIPTAPDARRTGVRAEKLADWGKRRSSGVTGKGVRWFEGGADEKPRSPAPGGLTSTPTIVVTEAF